MAIAEHKSPLTKIPQGAKMNLAFKATDLFQSLQTLLNVVNRWAGGRWKHVTPILPKKQQKLKCLPIWIPLTSCLIWRLTLVWEYIIPNSRITFLWSSKKSITWIFHRPWSLNVYYILTRRILLDSRSDRWGQ